MKSGNLNFLEPSEPLQACDGTALPLPLPFFTFLVTISNEANSFFGSLNIDLVWLSFLDLIMGTAVETTSDAVFIKLCTNVPLKTRCDIFQFTVFSTILPAV